MLHISHLLEKCDFWMVCRKVESKKNCKYDIWKQSLFLKAYLWNVIFIGFARLPVSVTWFCSCLQTLLWWCSRHDLCPEPADYDGVIVLIVQNKTKIYNSVYSNFQICYSLSVTLSLALHLFRRTLQQHSSISTRCSLLWRQFPLYFETPRETQVRLYSEETLTYKFMQKGSINKVWTLFCVQALLEVWFICHMISECSLVELAEDLGIPGIFLEIRLADLSIVQCNIRSAPPSQPDWKLSKAIRTPAIRNTKTTFPRTNAISSAPKACIFLLLNRIFSPFLSCPFS